MALPHGRTILHEALASIGKYIPKDSSVSHTFAAGTPIETEGYAEVTPDEGYDAFTLRYFRLITPPEVEGNILLTGLAGEETKMLAVNQAENTTMLHDSADFDQFFFVLVKFRLYGITTAETSAAQELRVELCGKMLKL